MPPTDSHARRDLLTLLVTGSVALTFAAIALAAEPGSRAFRNRWFGLAIAALFGAPAALALLRTCIGAARYDRLQSRLGGLVLGLLFEVFAAVLIAAGLTRSHEFSGGLPFLPEAVNRAAGGAAFVFAGLLMAALGLVPLGDGLGRLRRGR